MTAVKTVKVTQPKEVESEGLTNWISGIESAEYSTEIIAESIVSISAAMKRIEQSRLSRNALIILLQSQTGLGKKEIEKVLDALIELEEQWLKPPF